MGSTFLGLPTYFDCSFIPPAASGVFHFNSALVGAAAWLKEIKMNTDRNPKPLRSPMANWQESGGTVLGRQFSDRELAKLCRRTIDVLPGQLRLPAQRALKGDSSLMDEDWIKAVRPFFLSEAKKMLKEREETTGS
jgi:hypothetical protein